MDINKKFKYGSRHSVWKSILNTNLLNDKFQKHFGSAFELSGHINLIFSINTFNRLVKVCDISSHSFFLLNKSLIECVTYACSFYDIKTCGEEMKLSKNKKKFKNIK